MPEVITNDLLFFQIGQAEYDFKYDVAYPVLISFNHEDALGLEGYLFQYVYKLVFCFWIH